MRCDDDHATRTRLASAIWPAPTSKEVPKPRVRTGQKWTPIDSRTLWHIFSQQLRPLGPGDLTSLVATIFPQQALTKSPTDLQNFLD